MIKEDKLKICKFNKKIYLLINDIKFDWELHLM